MAIFLPLELCAKRAAPQLVKPIFWDEYKIEAAGIDNKLILRQQAIILSMTEKERKNPDLLKASRKIRIANGAGVSVNDVNCLLKQYEQTKLLMKNANNGKLARMFGRKF